MLLLALAVAAVGVAVAGVGHVEDGYYSVTRCGTTQVSVEGPYDHVGDADPVAYENLTDRQRRAFDRALDDGDAELDDSAGAMPSFVRYDGRYYRVIAGTFDCTAVGPLTLAAGLAAVVGGLAVAAVAARRAWRSSDG